MSLDVVCWTNKSWPIALAEFRHKWLGKQPELGKQPSYRALFIHVSLILKLQDLHILNLGFLATIIPGLIPVWQLFLFNIIWGCKITGLLLSWTTVWQMFSRLTHLQHSNGLSNFCLSTHTAVVLKKQNTKPMWSCQQRGRKSSRSESSNGIETVHKTTQVEQGCYKTRGYLFEEFINAYRYKEICTSAEWWELVHLRNICSSSWTDKPYLFLICLYGTSVPPRKSKRTELAAIKPALLLPQCSPG